MKTIILIIALAIGIQAQVYVNGYNKSNGTYVKPHYRTAPDSSKYNNRSYSNGSSFGSSSSSGSRSGTYGGARYDGMDYTQRQNQFKNQLR